MGRLAYKLKDLGWKIYRQFFPCHQKVRAAIPRQWCDLTEIIVDVNLAIIADFKDEFYCGYIDWDHTEDSRRFKEWYVQALEWVEYTRPKYVAESAAYLEKAFDIPDKLTNFGDIKTDELSLKHHEQLEQLIDETDKMFIKQMVDFKGYFWT